MPETNNTTLANSGVNENTGVVTKTPQITFVPIMRSNTFAGVKKGRGRSPSYRVISSSGEYQNSGVKMRDRSPSPTKRRSGSKSPSVGKNRNFLGGTVEAVNRNTPGSKPPTKNSRGRSASPSASRSKSPKRKDTRGVSKSPTGSRSKSPNRKNTKKRSPSPRSKTVKGKPRLVGSNNSSEHKKPKKQKR